jgi:hypothetical protein
MEAYFTKLPNSTLMPSSDQDRELLDKIKTGDTVKLKLTRPRNIQFHRKYFALLNLAFDYWNPPEHGDGSDPRFQVEKNFETFRKNIAVKAGYYIATYTLAGDIRMEAQSIAFGSMSEDEFEKLYSASINVILKYVMHNYTEGDLREAVTNLILEFA